MHNLSLRRAAVLGAIFTCVVLLTAINSSVAQNANVDDMDLTVKPGDDFYRYASGAWLKRAASNAGQGSYDNRATLMEKTNQRVRDLIEEAAAAHPAKGSVS